MALAPSPKGALVELRRLRAWALTHLLAGAVHIFGQLFGILRLSALVFGDLQDSARLRGLRGLMLLFALGLHGLGARAGGLGRGRLGHESKHQQKKPEPKAPPRPGAA